MKKYVWAAFLLIVLVFGAVGSAFAEKAKDSKAKVDAVSPQNGRDLLKQFSQALSGSAWLAVEGYDFPGENPVFQAAGAMGLVPYRSPAPAFSRNYLISRDVGTPVQTESSIAINPKDPNHLVVATIDYGLPYNSVYTSFDAGVTWQGPNRVPLSDGTDGAGDPVVAFDRNGNAYQVFMSVGEKLFDFGLFYGSFETSDIAIASSKDGLVWQKPTVAGATRFGSVLPTDEFGQTRWYIISSFPDKPWIAIGPDPQDLDKDAIYVTYTEFFYVSEVVYIGELPFLNLVQVEAAIMVSGSGDQGRTWSKPELLARQVLFGLGQNPGEEIMIWTVQGSQPQVAKNGNLYVAWYDSTEDGVDRGKAIINVSRSEDGGQTFIEPMKAAEFLEVERRPSTAFFRNPSSFPQMAVGPENEIYLIFGAKTEGKPTDDGDIYFVKSLDSGRTFSKPAQLNTDRTDKLQFFPAIVVDPQGGLNVMWGDMRDDPAGLKYHIYYTQSKDKGETWGFEFPERGVKEPDTRVTDFPSNPNRGFPGGRFIGDYFSIAASEKDVYLVWADTRLGEYGSFNQKVGFARRQAIPSAEVFISPPKGPGGQEVTVQAFNFQPDTNLFVKIGGSIVSAGRTSPDGGMTYRLFLPVAGEGAHDITVFDESGNTAVSSFYMDFGFGDLAPEPEKTATPERPKWTRQDFEFLAIMIISLVILAGMLWLHGRKKNN